MPKPTVEKGITGDEPPLPDKVVAIHEALKETKVAHAVGGAIALAYYVEPRATIDVDLNVFIPVTRWRDVVVTLGRLGVRTDDLDAAALERDGQCRLWWGRNPVDLFFAYAPIHDEMREDVRRVPFEGLMLPILSPEHLTVCKAMFDRRKDWLDIEKILLASDDFDLTAVQAWLRRMVGDTDPRLDRLEEVKTNLAQ